MARSIRYRSMDLIEIRDYELLRSFEFVQLVCGRSDGPVDGDSLVANEALRGLYPARHPP